MKITNNDITKGKNLFACEDGIKWAESLNGAELTNKNVDFPYFFWAVETKCYTGKLDLDLLDYCAEKSPSSALFHVAKHLAPEQLDYCAKKSPMSALEYTAKYLTPEKLDYCAEKEPGHALKYAVKYLTPEQLDYCAKKEPWFALYYTAKYLTPEQLDYCEKRIGQ